MTRRAVYWTSWAVVLGAALAGAQRVQAQASIASGEVYRLIARHSGKCMDGRGDRKLVRQWDENASADQQWRITATADGFYTIRSAGTDKALAASSASEGAAAQQVSADGSDAQKFRFIDDGNGFWRIVPKAREDGRCLTVSQQPGSTWDPTVNGAPVVIAAWSGRDCQEWRLEPVKPSLTAGQKKLINAMCDRVLDAGDTAADDAMITQTPYRGASGQRWQIVDAGMGWYRIRSIDSDRYVEPANGDKSNSPAVMLAALDERNDGQLWKFEPVEEPKGAYVIQNRLDSFALMPDEGGKQVVAKAWKLQPEGRWLVTETDAVAQSPRTEWFSKAGYGVMVRYRVTGDIAQVDQMCGSFDAEYLAQQLQDAGAGYVILTLGEDSGKYCAPNATLESYVARQLKTKHDDAQARRTPRTDVPMKLYYALHRNGRDIKLMLHLPSGTAQADETVMKALGWTPPPKDRLAGFQRRWESVIREWSNRYDEKVAGWVFDGCSRPELMYWHKDGPNFESFAAAARSGNANAIVMFNAGVGIRRASRCEDATFGEFPPAVITDITKLPVCNGQWVYANDPVRNWGYAVQWHILTPMGHDWGGYGPKVEAFSPASDTPRFGAAEVASYTKAVHQAGGVVTWDVPVDMSNGHLGENFMGHLKEIKAALGR